MKTNWIDEDTLETLRHVKIFIENGIEVGYIRMPDIGLPDTANDTLPMVKAAIAYLETQADPPLTLDQRNTTIDKARAEAQQATPPPGDGCGCRLERYYLGETDKLNRTDCLYADTLSKNTTLIRSLDLVSQALKESEIERDDALERGRVLELTLWQIAGSKASSTWASEKAKKALAQGAK